MPAAGQAWDDQRLGRLLPRGHAPEQVVEGVNRNTVYDMGARYLRTNASSLLVSAGKSYLESCRALVR